MGNKLGFGFDVDDGGAVRKINAVAKAFDKIGGKGSGASFFGNVGAKAVAKGFDLISSAASGTIGFLDQAVQSAMEDEASQKLLTIALQNNIPAWDGNTDSINAYIDAQTNRGFADDDTRASIGQLIGVTHDLTEAQKLNTLAEDLARAKGIDLATATDIVTKAHEGNGKALKGLGIQVDKTANSQQILDAITKNVTGSTEAYNQTLAGKMNVSQQKFNEAVEKIGYTLMPVLAEIMQKFADDWLPALGRGWDKLTTALRPVAEFLSTIVGLISKAIGAIDRMIKKLKELNVASIAIPPIPGLGVLPHFAQGGTVPGPLNSPQLIVAHGGETVVPTGGGGGHSHDIIMDGKKVAEAVGQRQFYQQRRAASAPTRV